MRTINRRNFVAGLSCVAVLGAASSSARAATPGKLDARDVNLSSGYSRAKFEALLNQTFYIDTHDHGVVTVKLIAVQATPVTTVQPIRIEQFSLTFRGLLLPSLPAGLYDVSHLSAGRVSLYLKALPQQRSQPMYRADFSLLQ
jgi:hypothetical protein